MADITSKRVDRLYENGDTKGLIKASRDGDPKVRTAAIAALALQLEFGGAATPELKKGAADVLLAAVDDPELAEDALNGLVGAQDARVKDVALRLLEPENPRRAKAASVLEKMPDPRAVQPLLQLLNDHDDQVRRNAACALGTLGDPCAADALYNAFQNDPDRGVNNRARTSLIQLKDPRMLEAVMLKALADLAEIYSRGKLVASFGGISASIDEGVIEHAGKDLNALGGFEAMKIAYARFCTLKQWPKAVEQDLFKSWVGIGEWGKQG